MRKTKSHLDVILLVVLRKIRVLDAEMNEDVIMVSLRPPVVQFVTEDFGIPTVGQPVANIRFGNFMENQINAVAEREAGSLPSNCRDGFFRGEGRSFLVHGVK